MRTLRCWNHGRSTSESKSLRYILYQCISRIEELILWIKNIFSLLMYYTRSFPKTENRYKLQNVKRKSELETQAGEPSQIKGTYLFLSGFWDSFSAPLLRKVSDVCFSQAAMRWLSNLAVVVAVKAPVRFLLSALCDGATRSPKITSSLGYQQSQSPW